MEGRENFGSRFGALMALAGSSVGLGNIWRFPYMAGTYGGAAFIIVYLILFFLICMPILSAELMLGRKSRANAFRTFEKFAPGSGWKWVGILMVITQACIISYYSVVGGWSIDYFFKAVCLDFTRAAETRGQLDGIFGAFIASPWKPLICHTIFLGLTAVIVAAGVQKGIERFGKIMMPVLFFIVLLIVVRSATLPGAGEGYRFLFNPEFSKITPGVCVAALGQAFFSLSVGIGTIMIYGSYVRKDDNIVRSSMGTAAADFIFAMLAGCAIMPAVFSFGLSPESGPGLVFETLPYIFSQMPLGDAIAIIFFFALLVAALTSSISMLEGIVALLVEERHFTRSKAVGLIFAVVWVAGALCSLSFGPISGFKILGRTIFDTFDNVSANWLMPICAILLVIFIGWKLPSRDLVAEFTNEGALPRNLAACRYIRFIIRYVAPIAILVILISGIVS
ncbi:MAG: sodium-dependent transporter [Bacteroidales bacterium]|nr:sodium-dependent transporter [Bacteroidales bacterium]